MRYLMDYEVTPGTQVTTRQKWPLGVDAFLDVKTNKIETAERDQQEDGSASLPMLVVVLHPRCICSRATLRELEEAATTFDHPYQAVVLVFQPSGGDTAWQSTDLYHDAQQALHAHVVTDIDGAIAAQFGAQTSGQVYLYSGAATSAERQLLFAGGVTAARGEVGDNRGLASLESAFHQAVLLEQSGFKTARAPSGLAEHTPVYGCGLFKLASLQPRMRG